MQDLPVDPDAAWAALAARDASYEGVFVYAVETTGVYCRPGCASRRPRRENVRFYAAPEAAEAAGFRPCKRCRPDDVGPSLAARSVERARAFLDAHLDETVTLERLARAAHMSPFHLQRTFKRHLGVSPRGYVEARRAERLKERLKAGDSVVRASYEAGYAAPSRLYDQGEARLGMTPGTYRRGGAGMEIRFATVETPLGRLLVAVTERGVCAVSLGEDDRALEEELRREYPRAAIERSEAGLERALEEVVSYLEGSSRDIPLPLDVEANAFELRVWAALRDIPYGERRSYGEVAAAIGRPTAARAVARACAANRAALVIPCHRVVRSDGALGGYRWGTERKRRLLEVESPSTRREQRS